MNEVVFDVLSLVGRHEFALGLDIKIDESGNKQDTQDDQIPMVQDFHTKDATQIAFMTELLKNRGGCASACILEIHGIGEVDNDGKAIDNHKHPFGEGLPAIVFFQMARQQHQKGKEEVGVDDGRGIEHP